MLPPYYGRQKMLKVGTYFYLFNLFWQKNHQVTNIAKILQAQFTIKSISKQQGI
jgi:hypothetical protein